MGSQSDFSDFYPTEDLIFTLPEGMSMTKISIMTYGGYYPFEADVDTGTFDSSTWVWTGDANQVTFTVKGSSTYLTNFTVTYKG